MFISAKQQSESVVHIQSFFFGCFTFFTLTTFSHLYSKKIFKYTFFVPKNVRAFELPKKKKKGRGGAGRERKITAPYNVERKGTVKGII